MCLLSRPYGALITHNHDLEYIWGRRNRWASVSVSLKQKEDVCVCIDCVSVSVFFDAYLYNKCPSAQMIQVHKKIKEV